MQNRIGLRNPGAAAAAAFLGFGGSRPASARGASASPPARASRTWGGRSARSARLPAPSQRAFEGRPRSGPSWYTLNLSCPNTEDDPHGRQTEELARRLARRAARDRWTAPRLGQGRAGPLRRRSWPGCVSAFMACGIARHRGHQHRGPAGARRAGHGGPQRCAAAAAGARHGGAGCTPSSSRVARTRRTSWPAAASSTVRTCVPSRRPAPAPPCSTRRSSSGARWRRRTSCVRPGGSAMPEPTASLAVADPATRLAVARALLEAGSGQRPARRPGDLQVGPALARLRGQPPAHLPPGRLARRHRRPGAVQVPRRDAAVEVVAGVESAGIPHSSALAFATGLPSVFVRKEAKDHGLGRRIEGGDVAGLHTLLVEDMVTTGGSSLSAVAALREAGATVGDLPGHHHLRLPRGTAGLRGGRRSSLHVLTTFETVVEEAGVRRALGRARRRGVVRAWLADPHGWAPMSGARAGAPRGAHGGGRLAALRRPRPRPRPAAGALPPRAPAAAGLRPLDHRRDPLRWWRPTSPTWPSTRPAGRPAGRSWPRRWPTLRTVDAGHLHHRRCQARRHRLHERRLRGGPLRRPRRATP